MSDEIDISNLNKAEVLAALYNNAKSQGMGLLMSSQDMTTQDAQDLLDLGQTYFDYVQGRVMKVDLSGDTLSTRLYNRDNGFEAAESVLQPLLEKAA